ncbi:unnamed protein product [Paramecium octaurelia]|uniref:Uncharacterized protein n=1 Tax=Paramecium octaurelia TaxID=43137 RepID=A0A8S1YR34_PAROT|nr:unnamed protein product [Paramecium octaurelia]
MAVYLQTLRMQDKLSVNQILSFVSQQLSIPINYYVAQPELQFNVLMNPGLKLEAFLSQAQLETKVSLKDFIFFVENHCEEFFLSTGKFYAIQFIDKEIIIAKKKQQIILNERNIMTILNSLFLLHLSFAFESIQFVVFIPEFWEGGELFFQLKQIKGIRELQYIAEIWFVCIPPIDFKGLNEIHSTNIFIQRNQT